jgi:hypothetical protein
MARLLHLCAKLDLLEIRLTLDNVEGFEYDHGQIKVLFVESKCIVVDLRLVQHVIDETLHHLLGVFLLPKQKKGIR